MNSNIIDPDGLRRKPERARALSQSIVSISSYSSIAETLLVSFFLLSPWIFFAQTAHGSSDSVQNAYPEETINLKQVPTFTLGNNARRYDPSAPMDIAVSISNSTSNTQKPHNSKKSASSVSEATSMSLLESASLVSTGDMSIDATLSYLRGKQTSLGNFGNASNTSSLVETVAVLQALRQLSLQNDTMYQDGINWLDAKFYEGIYTETLRLWTLAESGADVQYTFENIPAKQNSDDGGFGYSFSYASDPITTAQVLKTVHATGYTNPGNFPEYTKTQAILYLLNAQNADGGWGRTNDSSSNVESTTQVIDALRPYRLQTITSSGITVSIASVLNDAFAFLKQQQLANGTWNNNLLHTALAYDTLHTNGIALKHENEAYMYLINAQNSDGSFGNENTLVTAHVLRALSWKLLNPKPDITITNITPTGPLVNGTPTTVALKIKNNGKAPVGSADIKLYNFSELYNWLPGGATFLPAGSSLEPNQEVTVTVNLNTTASYLGTTTLLFYVEVNSDQNPEDNWGTRSVFFTGGTSPVMPLYYSAFEHDTSAGVRVRWPVRPDPNRSNYVVLYRKMGSTTWDGIMLSNTTGSVGLTNFTPGTMYEVTMGVRNASNQTTFFSNFTNILASTNDTKGSVEGLLTEHHRPLGARTLTGHLISTTTTGGTLNNFSLTSLQHGTNALWSDSPEYEKIITRFGITSGTTTKNIRVFTRLTDDEVAPTIQYVKLASNVLEVQAGTTSLIEIAGSDNVNTKEVDLSYFDPKIAQWVFIKTIPILGSITAYTTYSWLVPEDISGTGFKLSATIRDHKGNVSSLFEYGPFTITPKSGTPPTFSFVEPDGSNDKADSEFLIQWIDADPDSDARISIFADTDSTGFNGISIVENISEDVAINEYRWDTTSLQNGTYYIYAHISDGTHATTSVYAPHGITIHHPPKPIPPGNPYNLTGVSASSSIVTLTWNAPTTSGDKPITGYQIDRKRAGEVNFTTIIGNTGTTSTRHTDTDLQSTTTYIYRVAAISEAGVSTYSNTATVTTPTPNTPPTFTFIEPNGVGDTAVASFKITWSDADPDSNARIALYYDTDAFGFNGTAITTSLSEDSATNSFTWSTSVRPQGLYYLYAVIGDGRATSSVYSAFPVNVIKVPKPPTNLTVSSVSATSTRLSWKAPLDTGGSPITGYQILRAIGTSTTFSTLVSNTGTTSTTYTNTGLNASTTYTYIVRARNLAGTSANSSTTATTTLPFHWRIFTDNLTSGWTRTTTNLVATVPFTGKAYTGTGSIKLSSASATSSILIKKSSGSENTTGRSNVRFTFQPSATTSASQITINLTDSSGGHLVTVPLSTYGTTTLHTNTWYTYTIPLSVLNGTNRNISGLRWFLSTQGTFYLDEIFLQ